jgi:predicted HAD superfamily Cof-like phosphohydrolase
MYYTWRKRMSDAIGVDTEKGGIIPRAKMEQMVADMKKALGPTNSYERVREFMEKFGHPVYDSPTEIMDADWLHMRLGLIREELGELYEACGYEVGEWLEVEPVRQMDRTDVVAAADALGDLEYVVNGMALGMGIPLPAVVKEIHRSNMTKLGADGKPIYREDGKILKGPDYEQPDLRKVLGV